MAWELKLAQHIMYVSLAPVLSTWTWKVFVFDGGEGQAEDKRRKGVNAAAQVELSRCYA